MSEKRMLECQKIAKNWLRMFKIQELNFDSIFFTDESPGTKKNSI
jgi:hypothetical protein